MDEELDLGRYTAAIRRHARVIVAVMVIGAAMGLAYGARAPYVASGTITWVDRAAELSSAGIDPDDVDLRQAVNQVTAVLVADGFEESLDVDASVDATGVFTEEQDSVLVFVEADSVGDAERAASQATEVARRTYVDEVRTLTDGVSANFARAGETLALQLESIDRQVAAASAAQTTLTETLLAQAEIIRGRQADLADQRSALEAYSASLDQDMRFQTPSTPERQRSPALMAVVGAVVCGLLAVGVIAVAAALDRRIRTRRDLDRIGLTDLLGGVSRDLEPGELDLVAAAIERAANRTGHHRVQLVPVDGSSEIALAQAFVSRLDSLEVVDRPPLERDASETASAATDSLSVVVVRWGRDSRVSTMSVANRLAAASDSPVAVLLIDIPRRELIRIEQ
jgi:capsular polysaccharide biosynthesis protein